MNKSSYIPALDGVRFLAVSMVVFDHWSGDAFVFQASYLGVCMFFVLSGFLITRILLHAKQKDEASGRGHGFSLRQFYIRRTIRIFPLYYLTLAVLFLLNVPPIREKIGWFLTYNTNNYIAIFQQWLGSSDHLWSLAVEEQFYIFFPFTVFFISFRKLPKLFIGLIGISVLLRAGFYFAGFSWVTPYVLMFTCLDAFGLGSLLAYNYFTNNQKVVDYFSSWTPLFLGLLVYVMTVFLTKNSGEAHNFFTVVLLRLAESVLSVALIGKLCCTDTQSATPAERAFVGFFTLPLAIFIGKISYGIYLFHNYLYNPYHATDSHLFVRLMAKFPVLQHSLPLKLAVLYVAVIALASVSWFAFEKPINALKDRFGY